MKIAEIKKVFTDFDISGHLETEFSGICIDSRAVKPGDLFVAIRGVNIDGHCFVEEALRKGAIGAVVESEMNLPPGITKIRVKDSREAYARLSCLFFDFPSDKLKLVGITGTMGKTTTGYLLYSLFRSCGVKTGFIGTNNYYIDGERKRSSSLPPTTPDSFKFNAILNEMVKSGVNYVFAEITSHAINQKRAFGMTFYSKILTTMGVDHLDFHKSVEDYVYTKVSFFSNFRAPIINLDTKYLEDFASASVEPVFYSRKQPADFWASAEESDKNGYHFNLMKRDQLLARIFLRMLGDFNIYNFLAVSTFAIREGIDMNTIREFAADAPNVPGRMEYIESKDRRVVIDFAHNPDEFRNVLASLRQKTSGRLITVFGVVGFSEKSKRMEMGKVASEYSDYVIVTTDDPRGDDPSVIAEDAFSCVVSGEIILDRGNAIRKALQLCQPGDLVAVLGRGDESVIHYKEGEFEFSDIEFVKEVIK